MRIEVDQSGRIEYTRTKTVLAFSDSQSYSILIPAKIKRKCLRYLSLSGKTKRAASLILFSVGVVLLIRDFSDRIDQLIIDREFEGNEPTIKRHLMNLIRKCGLKLGAGDISFVSIGKKSRAHVLALETFRGEKNADRKIVFKEIFPYL